MVYDDDAATVVGTTEAPISVPKPALIPLVPAQLGSATITGQATQSTVSANVELALTTTVINYAYLACFTE